MRAQVGGERVGQSGKDDHVVEWYRRGWGRGDKLKTFSLFIGPAHACYFKVQTNVNIIL